MDKRDKQYNLRENPKKTDRSRSLSKSRAESRDRRAKNLRVHESNAREIDQVEIRELGTTDIVQMTQETTQDDIGLDRGDYTDNQNTTLTSTTIKEPNPDLGGILHFLQRMEQKIDQNKQELQEQNRQILDTLETQKQELTEIRAELNNIRDEIHQEINTQIDKNNEIIMYAVNEKFTEWENKQNTILTNNKEECVQETLNLCHTLNKEIHNELEQQKVNHQQYQAENKKFKESTEAKFTNLNHSLREIKNDLNKNKDDITELKENTNQLKEKLEQVGRETQNASMGFVKEIYVTCQGTENAEMNLKFNGRERTPVEFINHFKRYLEKLKNRRGKDQVNFGDLLENVLEDSAARWWQVIKNEIQTIEEFEKALIEKYWNSDIQRGIKRRLELERYRPGGKLTRAEYFIDRVLTLKNMTPPLDEQEIVEFLSEQFSERVQDARRVQNVNTIRGFEKLLAREDLNERNSQIRSRNTHDSRRSEQWQEQRGERNERWNTPKDRPSKSDYYYDSRRQDQNNRPYRPNKEQDGRQQGPPRRENSPMADS